MSTGLMHAGVMFAKTYYERADPGTAGTARVSSLAASLLARCSGTACSVQ